MKRSKGGVIKRVVGFLESALLQCFFGCFRIRDDHHRASRSLTNNKDSLLPEERVDSVLCLEDGSSSGQLPNAIKQEGFCNQSSLEYEAKYFKTCGALPENLAQAEKSPQKLDFQLPDEDGITSVFNSWRPGGSAKLQHMKEPFDSVTPIEVNSDLPEKGYTCCNFDDKCTQGRKLQFKITEQVLEDELEDKSLHMESSPLNTKSKVHEFGFNDSPHPTPLHLMDEMPTPATVYPESAKPGKHARIRTQYVYPVLKPVENLVHWKELRETIPRHVQSIDWSEQQLKNPKGHDTVVKQQSSITPGSLSAKLSSTGFLSSGDKRIQEKDLVSIRNLNSSNLTDGAENQNLNSGALEAVATNMSLGFKSEPLTNNTEGIDCMPKEPSQPPKSFDEDRPIIGIVAAHWNDIQTSHATPKWWDGNGIPNSTRKYKEDQKVSWHATPFEERLEKVLSDEKILPHRKLQYRRPIEFEEEGMDYDT